MNFQARRGRSKRAPVAIEVTSLVDVVFLLIIFLLVTTTFKKHEYAFVIELPTASSQQVTIEADRTTIFVTQDGEYYLLEVGEEQAVEPSALDASDKLDKEALRAHLEALHARRPDAAIAVRGERAASYQSLIGVVEILQTVGFKTIWFPYQFGPDGGASPPP